MLLQCTNGKCRQMAEVKLDPVTDEVICLQCGNPIKTVTSFIKVQLRTQKQFIKRAKDNQAFSIQCPKCGKKVVPAPINKELTEFKCPECQSKFSLTKAFENVLREQLRRNPAKK